MSNLCHYKIINENLEGINRFCVSLAVPADNLHISHCGLARLSRRFLWADRIILSCMLPLMIDSSLIHSDSNMKADWMKVKTWWSLNKIFASDSQTGKI